jgi:hypothetical protein
MSSLSDVILNDHGPTHAGEMRSGAMRFAQLGTRGYPFGTRDELA